MSKLVLIILLCFWSTGSDANNVARQQGCIEAAASPRSEPVDWFNPFSVLL